MKKILIIALSGLAFISMSNAQIITAGGVQSTTDLFQNATVTASSSRLATPTADDTTPSGIFGGTGNFGSGITYFNGGVSTVPVHFIEFNTSAPITFSQIRLFVREEGTADPATSYRSISRYTLFASSSPGSFTNSNIVSTSTINPDYSGTYGNFQITITDTFNAYTTAQYFRLNLNSADSFGATVIELDAFSVSPVPEPSTYLFLGLSALLFVVFKSSTRKKEII